MKKSMLWEKTTLLRPLFFFYMMVYGYYLLHYCGVNKVEDVDRT